MEQNSTKCARNTCGIDLPFDFCQYTRYHSPLLVCLSSVSFAPISRCCRFLSLSLVCYYCLFTHIPPKYWPLLKMAKNNNNFAFIRRFKYGLDVYANYACVVFMCSGSHFTVIFKLLAVVMVNDQLKCIWLDCCWNLYNDRCKPIKPNNNKAILLNFTINIEPSNKANKIFNEYFTSKAIKSWAGGLCKIDIISVTSHWFSWLISFEVYFIEFWE